VLDEYLPNKLELLIWVKQVRTVRTFRTKTKLDLIFTIGTGFYLESSSLLQFHCGLVRSGLTLGVWKFQNQTESILFWKIGCRIGFPILFLCESGTKHIVSYISEPDLETLHRIKKTAQTMVLNFWTYHTIQGKVIRWRVCLFLGGGRVVTGKEAG
jgi:hypothetical protein